LLRIEDIDTTRCRAEFETAIKEDLCWLGLAFEEPVRRQSEHLSDYEVALDRLAARKLVYPCFCTRSEIAAEIARAGSPPQGPDGPVYPGTCRQLQQSVREERLRTSSSYALRLDVAKAAAELDKPLTFVEQGMGPEDQHGTQLVQPDLFGDIVIARKELRTSYHLAVVVDYALQGVTLISRGNDLFRATHVQRLLQASLELEAPAYFHHRLILDAEGKKFSKRDLAVT